MFSWFNLVELGLTGISLMVICLVPIAFIETIVAQTEIKESMENVIDKSASSFISVKKVNHQIGGYQVKYFILVNNYYGINRSYSFFLEECQEYYLYSGNIDNFSPEKLEILKPQQIKNECYFKCIFNSGYYWIIIKK